MANTDITITLTPEITFDPPDAAPGWYVTIWTQIANTPRTGQRYGPIPFEQIDEFARNLLDEERARIQENIKYAMEHMRNGQTRT